MIKTVRDDWLANILGRDSFKVEVSRESGTAQIREGLRHKRPAFYYAKLSTDSVAAMHAFAAIGFYVVDVNVTLQRPPLTDPVARTSSNCLICEFDPERHGEIARIGEECFIFSRFHLDPKVSNETANRIKRAWVENCMAGKRGDCVWVAESLDRPVGFLTMLTVANNGQRTAVIDLVGVDRRNQGRGIGRALVQQALQQPGGSIDMIRVGTQVANVPSLRLYESLGFRIVRTDYVLHAHF